MDFVLVGNIIELIIPIIIAIFFGLAYFSPKFLKKYTLLPEKYNLWYLWIAIFCVIGSVLQLLRFLGII